jgi:SAM-dependent methyltransferase
VPHTLSRMGDDRATVEYFEHHAHDYSPARMQTAVTFIAEHVTPDASLIDIGCGTGNVLAHIARTAGISQLAGLDISQRCVELTKEKVAADVYQASVLDDATVGRFHGSFHFAVMAAVLHHLVGPNRRHSRRAGDRAVSNALEMVKPGGYLIVMEPTFTPAATVFALFWIKTVLSKIFHRRLPIGGYWNNIGPPVVSYYSSEQVLAMLLASPSAEIIQVHDEPQRLSKLAGLVVSKSNTTVIARRRTTG